MTKHLILAILAAAGTAACESGDKRSTSATTTRSTATTSRAGYQTASARDMQQGWVPGHPPAATRSTNLANAEAAAGTSVDSRTTGSRTTLTSNGTTRDSGFAVRPAAYTGPAGPAPTAAPISAEGFAREAMSGDQFEIESSRVALERASDERIRQFAQMMVDDHGGAYDQLAQAAGTLGVEPSKGPGPRQQALLERLSGLQGADFDREFSQIQADAHQEAVRLHERFLQSGHNPQLQALAEQRLPIIRDHLKQARALAEDLDPALRANGRTGATNERPPAMDRDAMRPRAVPVRDPVRPETTPGPAPRETPGMTPGKQPDKPTGPDQPENPPAGEPDPR